MSIQVAAIRDDDPPARAEAARSLDAPGGGLATGRPRRAGRP